MDSTTAITYRPDAGKQWRSCLAMLGVGTVGALAVLLQARPPAAAPLLLLAAALCIVHGLISLLGITRGLPRLIIDREGVVLRSATGSKSATWNTLGAFTVEPRTGRRGKQIRSASAPLFGPSGLWAGKTFSIPDAFRAPLTTIVADLTAMHGRASDPAASFPRARVPPERPIGVAGFRWPWLTAALFAAFVLVFVLEQRLDVTPGTDPLTPSVPTLLALGALSQPLVLSVEWYRLLTAPFPHQGLAHLVGNGIAFVPAGYALERLVGRAWMFCIFAGGALAGSLMSLALIGPDTVSVGASGAILAMLVALFLISFRLPTGSAKTQIQIRAGRVVIPAVLPMLGAGRLSISTTAPISEAYCSARCLGGSCCGHGAMIPVCRGSEVSLSARPRSRPWPAPAPPVPSRVGIRLIPSRYG